MRAAGEAEWSAAAGRRDRARSAGPRPRPRAGAGEPAADAEEEDEYADVGPGAWAAGPTGTEETAGRAQRAARFDAADAAAADADAAAAAPRGRASRRRISGRSRSPHRRTRRARSPRCRCRRRSRGAGACPRGPPADDGFDPLARRRPGSSGPRGRGEPVEASTPAPAAPGLVGAADPADAATVISPSARTAGMVEGDLERAAQERGLRLDGAVYASVAAALAGDRHVVLVGPPGAGKTSLALAVAKAARGTPGRPDGGRMLAAGR